MIERLGGTGGSADELALPEAAPAIQLTAQAEGVALVVILALLLLVLAFLYFGWAGDARP